MDWLVVGGAGHCGLVANKGLSMRWPLWLLLCCLLPACSSGPIRAPVGDHSRKPARIPAAHTVGQSDTLYSVAFLYGRTVEQLAAWNGIRKPYTIYRGQKIRLGAPVQKPSPVLPRQTPRRPVVNPPAHHASRPKVAISRPRSAALAHPASRRLLRWAWPASGTLVRHFEARSTGKKGINIAGKAGSPVRAAAAGKVVYAGSGLSGYGRLIIIKHNKNFLSAYAYNRKLIAREGQWVKSGELIARMGSSATDRIELHFEIRKKGRPVDPLRYLPKR